MNENALFDMLPLVISELEQTGAKYRKDINEGDKIDHIRNCAVMSLHCYEYFVCPDCDEYHNDLLDSWYHEAQKLLFKKGLFYWAEDGSLKA